MLYYPRTQTRYSAQPCNTPPPNAANINNATRTTPRHCRPHTAATL